MSTADIQDIFPDIPEAFSQALLRRGIGKLSDIQAAVIPFLLGKTSGGVVPQAVTPHLLFTAPTGTGKTFAYLLPLLSRINAEADGLPNRADRGPRQGPALLVLAPTHELCAQIKGELDYLLEALEGESAAALLIGSVPMGRQIEGLKKKPPLAAVGNPARLLQLVRMKKLSLKNLRFLVLDEGDRLMAEELFPETAELCAEAFRSGTPQTAACSATFPAKSRERLFALSGEWRIIEESGLSILKERIEHWAFFAEERKKIDTLRSLLAAAKPKKALVFTSRGGDAGKIVSALQYRHLAAGGIWGDMDRKSRKAALDAFRGGALSILVSSDLACRGLDVPGISHVIALDVPESEEAYLHRAGRTGRAGKRGIMASIGGEGELRRLARIEKRLGITVYPKMLYRGLILRADEPEEKPSNTALPSKDQ